MGGDTAEECALLLSRELYSTTMYVHCMRLGLLATSIQTLNLEGWLTL